MFIGNASYANAGIGIDVADDGPPLNDEAAVPYDTDGVQNYPVVTSVVHSGGDTIVSGYIKTQGFLQDIQLFHNSVMDAKTEGEKVIDVFAVTLDGNGFATFTRTISGFLADNVTATAVTSTCSNSPAAWSTAAPSIRRRSRFPIPLVVTNTADAGPGSLRDAITFANQCGAAPTITFNIPGAGVQTIIPATALPAPACGGTVIDGYTQPGRARTASRSAATAQRLIEIDGRATPGASGLEIGASGIVVRGLIVDDSGAQNAISVNAPAGASSIQVYGNILGDPTGTRAKKNSRGIRPPPRTR